MKWNVISQNCSAFSQQIFNVFNLIVYFVQIETSLRLKRITLFFCIFCYLILFEKDIAVNTIDIGGGLGISPYVSIFSLI